MKSFCINVLSKKKKLIFFQIEIDFGKEIDSRTVNSTASSGYFPVQRGFLLNTRNPH